MTEIEPIPLSRLTTLQTGAAPARMIDASTRDELVATLRDVWSSGEQWFVLGGGSNVFVGDEPFEGTVVRVLTQGIETTASSRPGFVRVRAEAGHGWDEFVEYAVQHGLAGIEAMSGIPGTVGASPVQNVGAYGQEIADTLVEVELIDEGTHDVAVVSAADLGLGFRTSVLKRHYGSFEARSAVILSATFELEVVGSGRRPVESTRLRAALGLEPDAEVSLGWIRDHVLATRRTKGMVLDDADADTASAGSFFQNPIVSESFARTLPPECPRWPLVPLVDAMTVIPLADYDGVVPPAVETPLDVKLSAAWLIENAGLRKGFALARSRASLSTKHALALTNRGGASAGELAQLARFVQQRVQSEFGLVLQPEPVLIGVEI